MTQKKNGASLLILSVTILFLASLAITYVRAPAGPSYTLGASPTTLNEEEGNVIITFTITGGSTNTAYTFRFTMTKPGGTGQAYCDESFSTDSSGGATQVFTYPNNTQTWNLFMWMFSTNVDVIYYVTIVEAVCK